MKVPFNKMPVCGGEIENIAKAIEIGHLQGDGIFLRSCEEKLRTICKSKSALVTNSCTSSLEMAAFLCDIRAGDEVIVPTYTFVSSASAFALRGAVPVFCDVKRETLNIDETKIEALITEKTKAIVVVHYAGVSCEMDAIMDIANRRNLKVVEDAAQGMCAYYKGRHLGTIGDLGSLSFHGTKNVVCGEGGALLFQDEKFFDRANFLREKGTNRIHFTEGKIDKYTWVDYGSSYIPTELSTAFLDAQLNFAEKLTSSRVAAWNAYYVRLKALEDAGKISLASVPSHCKTNAHIFFLLTSSESEKSALANFLKEREISALSHYAPLHLCPMAKTLGSPQMSLPVAEEAAKTMLRLPIFSDISEEQIAHVCKTVEDFYLR